MRADRAAAYDVPAHASLDALLAEPNLDAVAIATPAATHGALARRALEAGRHVFVEKPLCLNLAEAEALDALARERKLTLMVGHLLLYHPAFEALRELLAAGRLGPLRYIYSNRASLGRIRREENALWSFAPHDVSMILQLSGLMPERVTCSGGAWLHPPVADTSLTHMTFPGGLQAHIFVSWLHPYKDHKLVVVGEDAMAVFDDVQVGEDKLRLYRHQVGWNGDIQAVDKAEAEPIAYGGEEPLARECAHFLDCVREGKSPLSNAAEGRRVLAVLDACERALVSGNAVAPA
jgi:UDP-2-acetamido-3-amino-2,3-dideoxy-glucuronate N-acetyltransferase